MTKLANTISRVMMTAVSLLRPRPNYHANIQTWVETEYRNDPNYAYHCLINGVKPRMP